MTERNTLPSPPRVLLSKVPEATLLFWAIKICTTGMGEAASDFMGTRPVVLAGLLVAATAGLAVGLAVRQFRADRYVPWIYWGTVAMISVFGTVAADGVRTVLGLSYAVTTIVFALAVAALLITWYRCEGTLSIHEITTRRRETFYWLTVCATFALGTAAGDLTANSLGLGYLDSGLLFLAVIAVPFLLHKGTDGRLLNATAAFWASYIVTRPLGASFADWSAVPSRDGGLHLGTGPVTLVLLVVILGLVSLEHGRHDAGFLATAPVAQ